MKSRIYIIMISLLVSAQALACGYYSYYNRDLKLYRAVPDAESAQVCESRANDAENLLLWQKLAGKRIPVDSIKTVVYKWSGDELGKMLHKSDNPFAQWLAKPGNSDALRMLQLAKEVEEIRTAMLDEWYYRDADDDYHRRLKDLLAESLAGLRGRHVSRYAVQTARIMRSLGLNAELVEWWDTVQQKLPAGVLRRMTADYVGGACEKIGNKTKAAELYKESENLLGLAQMDYQLPAARLGLGNRDCDAEIRKMANVFMAYPNHPWLKERCQKLISRFEDRISALNVMCELNDPITLLQPEIVKLRNVEGYDQIRSLRKFAEKAARDKNVKDPGFWHYTAAFIYSLEGRNAKAERYLRLAERESKSADVAEAIKAFRIYFDIRSKNVKAWLPTLQANLEWIDSRLVKDLKGRSVNSYNLCDGYSISYWTDVERKICSEAVSKLNDAGNRTLAAMVANYGINRPLQIASKECNRWVEMKDENGETYNKCEEFKVSPNERDVDYGRDFSNEFFCLLSGMTAAQAEKYVAHARNPRSKLEKWLSAGGFNDDDYLNDIVGTIYLREMNYAKAARWLSKVDPSYQEKTNVNYYMRLDPFKWQDRDNPIKDSRNYKLNFANRMAKLQTAMNSSKNPDERAQARIRYAIGLRNSFGRCWALTRYYFSGYPRGRDDEAWESGNPRFSSFRESFKGDKYAEKAYRIADRQIDKALKEFISPELAAQAQLEMKNFKTVVSRYPGTEAAKFVRGHCDVYRDYALQTR